MNSPPQELYWWQRGVVYQIYPRSFDDTTGNGVGDLAGIIAQLDYLAGLGVDAIWISPFYPSPMADFGYDVADYCDVAPLFGDLATFDRLVAEAHARELKIIIDWVPNHSSDQHRWFVESRSSRDNPKRDWYIWRDPAPDGGPPNNWGSFFGGSAWTFDERTGQYYLHQFVPGQPELNWRNPAVREAMYDTLRFWLERGVDGFRMDVIGLLMKDAELRDNPINPDAPTDLPPNDLFGRLLPVHNMFLPENHARMREIRQVFDEYNERCAIGELWGPLDEWVKYYGEEGDELHLPFNFRLMDGMSWDAQQMRASVDTLEAVLPDFAWPNYVLGNHDRARLATRFGGEAQARLAALLLLTLRGTPTLYYGDELGMPNVDIPPEKVQDPQGINLGIKRTRDVCRTPMQWDASANAGFSPAGVETWLPLTDDYATRNVAVQSQDPTSILHLYRRLLAYRRATPALYGGSYTPLDVATQDCYVYLRAEGEEKRLIALNFSAGPRTLTIPTVSSGNVALSTYLDREGAVAGETLELRAYEGVIVEIDGGEQGTGSRE
ncbi:MAG: alpha-amylase family glycosyl hydrolase [Chloroflexota bacterium]|nr:alpha-amylase family glycosyl hydrolase [Chloroflexota bacterium]